MAPVTGLDLARAFFHQAVQPIVARRWARLPYSAALIGSGSEVLGYDDAVSTDHHWGPRLMLFLAPTDLQRVARPLHETLATELPYRFMGYSTNFSAPKSGDGDQGTQLLQDISAGKINHRVEILTLDDYLQNYLGLTAQQELTAADWLSIPQQKLLSFTAGEVFRDDLDLTALRARFDYYPDDVWIYLLACGWSRIGQDEHLAPRAAMVGDEIGAALIANRIVRSIILLCFLMARRYAPYAKWLGSAFGTLPLSAALQPVLRDIQSAPNEKQRQTALGAAYAQLNQLHNALGLTPEIKPALIPFHGRGFNVSGAWRYCDALLEMIGDVQLRIAAKQAPIGSVDQFSDNTDLLVAVHLREKLAALYQ